MRALMDGQELRCKGAGQADRDPPSSTSRRSELFGLAAMLELLVLAKVNVPCLHDAARG